MSGSATDPQTRLLDALEDAVDMIQGAFDEPRYAEILLTIADFKGAPQPPPLAPDVTAMLEGQRDALREALEAARGQLHHIMRNAEMSAGIMLDPRRTGNWAGARKTADAFHRIGLRAAGAKAALSAALSVGGS